MGSRRLSARGIRFGATSGAAACGLAIGVLAWAVCLAGCGQDTGGRLAISGRVNLQGTPLETGTVEFVSTDGAYQSGGAITKGTYAVPAAKGLPPGKYTVRISAIRETSPVPTGPPGPEAVKHQVQDLVPPEYNALSKLTAEVQAGARNHFEFDLK